MDVEDPFRWLEDQNSPATRSFIAGEQQAYRQYLGGHERTRLRLERRVRELLTVPTVDLPISDHRGRLFYLKRAADEEQKAIWMMDEAGCERRILSIRMLGGDSATSLAIIQVSPDGRFLAFGIRSGGEDEQQIGIYDCKEERLLPERLRRGFYRGLAFDQSQSGFYYVHEDAAGRYKNRRAVRRHDFGTDPSEDSEIFYAGEGPELRLILQAAEDYSALGYIIASLASAPETRFLLHRFPLDEPPREITRLSRTGFGARIFAHGIEAATDLSAPLGRIVRVQLDDQRVDCWTTAIAEMAESILSFEHWGDSWVVHYSAGSRLLTRVFSPSGELVRIIQYPESGTSTLGQVDGRTNRLFYAHSDISDPPTIFSVDLGTGEHRIWWRQRLPNRLPELEIEERTYPSLDGTPISITLIHPRGGDRLHPVLLSAYGAAGVSTTSKFSVLLTILAECGFTCAIAHVRGGGEGGLNWHRTARKQRKQFSVDDLIGAAEWLVKEQYTTSDLLSVAGQSAGGLLALCAITQKPRLFRAALALGPLADLTRFHLFGVARGFVGELGSPDDPDEFRALFRLSPYHRVSQGVEYPAVLIISGDRDKRCDSLHARKMIARLKSSAIPSHPILLDYSELRGHKPVLPLTERIRALTDRLTFLVAELGADTSEAHRL